MTTITIDGRPVLESMIAAVKEGAKTLVQEHREITRLRGSRGDTSVITATIDLKAENIIMDALTAAFPHIGFEAEESGIIKGHDEEHSWILDPLDGTANFLHGIPFFGVSLALRKGDDIIAAVVANPMMDEYFWAEKGGGAFFNGDKIHVSACERIDRAMLSNGTPWGTAGSKNSFLDSVSRVMSFSSRLRRFGSASLDLAYVAAGRYDGYFVTHLSPWDIAAGILLVEEAGGTVTEIDGGHQPLQSGSVLATNSHLHGVLINLLRKDVVVHSIPG